MAEIQSTSLALSSQYRHEYNCWRSMRARCSNPKSTSWKYYGEKGIKVCDRWQVSFAAFLADMGAAPSSIHQIERDRSDMNYCPENCSWATPAEQQMNTSKVRFITFRDVELPLQDWARIFGVNQNTLRSRLDEFNMSVEEAFTKPVMAQDHSGRPSKRK